MLISKFTVARRAAFAATVALAVLAMSPASGHGTPVVAPAPQSGVTVGLGDSQSTVTLVVGQTLRVSLGAEFRPPTLTGAALETLAARGGYPTGQPLTALYRAVSPGPADLATQSDHACLHGTPPCALPIRFWTVHIDVVGR